MADIDQSQATETDKGPAADEGGFSEAFAERASPEAKPGDAGGADATASAEGGQSATADQPEAATEVAADAGSGKAPAFDPFAGFTPEQKAHWDKVQASERSNRGRVGALTKKLNGLTQQGTQPPPAASDTGDSREGVDEGAATAAGTTGEAQTASDIDKRLGEAVEEYGDIIGPLHEVVTDLRKQIATLEASPKRHEVTVEDAEAMAEAYDKLAEAHSDYQEIASSPGFSTWLGGQPKSVQNLANSYDPQEVSLALTLFKAESKVSSEATTEESEGKGGTATGDKRERQLDGLRNPTSRGAPAAAGVPNEFGSAFKARAEKHKAA